MTRRPIVALGMVALALNCCAVAHAGYEDEVLADDPVAYWRLNDADFEAESLGFGDVFAEYHDEVTQQVPGLIATDPDNKAVRFLGADDVANGEDLSGIHIPDFDGFNIGGPFEEKTIVLWFQADNVDPVDEQVLFEEGGSTRGINLYIAEGEAYVGAWNRADDDGGLSTPWESGDDDPFGGNVYLSTPVSSGEIYQLALVMEGDTEGIEGTLTGYLNGQAFGMKTGVGQLFNHGDDGGIGHVHQNTYFQSGNWNNGHGMHFAGVIDEVALFNTALSADRIAALYQAGAGDVGLRGDFNGDGVIDAVDIDLLSVEVQQGNNPSTFDLNNDALVTNDDRVVWIKEIKNTFVGDANLDGEFGSADLVVVFSAGKYETNEAAGWAAGDWNGDGVFASGDLVAAFSDGGYELGPAPPMNAVPEPSGALLLLIGSLAFGRLRLKAE